MRKRIKIKLPLVNEKTDSTLDIQDLTKRKINKIFMKMKTNSRARR